MHRDDIAGYVNQQLETYRLVREEVEESWLECWAKYLNTPPTVNFLRDSTLKRVGDISTDWRHKLSGGKCYESVETIVGYLMAATFPNRDWFTAEPTTYKASEDHISELKIARLIKRHVASKMDESGFKSAWNVFIRQMVVTGTSVIALPWRTTSTKKPQRKPTELQGDIDTTYEVVMEDVVEYDAPSIEVLDVFDCYIDPHGHDPNKGNFIRKLRKTKGEVINMIKSGEYDCDAIDVINYSSEGYDTSTSRRDMLTMFEGLQVRSWHPTELVELVEYWGDIYDAETGELAENMVVTLLGDKLLSYEPSPFWCGKPFIIGTYSLTGHSPYGFGGVQPTLGLLHQLDTITNQRLDNLELAVNSMWTLRSDGVLQPDEVYTEPGRVFLVADHDDLRPLQPPAQTWTVTYQEAGLLEQSIDKTFGTGNYISSNQQRSGERVTATEVAAVRDAGGNRLSIVHKHIEETALIPMLSKLFTMVQQYTVEDVVVRVASDEPDAFEYWALSPEDFNTPLKLRPVGSDNVIERKQYIQERLEFVNSVAAIPEVAQMLDMKRIVIDLLQHWGFDEPEAYLKSAEAPSEDVVAPSPLQDPMSAAIAQAPSTGVANALQAQQMADGGASMMNTMFAGSHVSPDTNFEQQVENIDAASQQPQQPIPQQ